MLAAFARPAEARGPTQSFQMLDGFFYPSVAQGLDNAPLEYASGAKSGLHRLTADHPAAASREFFQQRYGAWLKP
jgi:hypothetical protein